MRQFINRFTIWYEEKMRWADDKNKKLYHVFVVLNVITLAFMAGLVTQATQIIALTIVILYFITQALCIAVIHKDEVLKRKQRKAVNK